MKTKLRSNQCSKCENTHEKCADGRRCKKWRRSYEVCIVFGTRPFKPGFSGARISL
jgi:hypothetical protein